MGLVDTSLAKPLKFILKKKKSYLRHLNKILCSNLKLVNGHKIHLKDFQSKAEVHTSLVTKTLAVDSAKKVTL